jgi:hypothetical protein
MPINPSITIDVVQVASLALAPTPTCDPAIALEAQPDGRSLGQLLTEYVRTRDPALIDKIPTRPGQRMIRWRVSPLSPAAYRWAMSATGVDRLQRAFCAAVHSYVDADGHEVTASKHGPLDTQTRGMVLAPPEWLDHVQMTAGAAVIDEMAAVALERAKAGPRALAPFSLPLGLDLLL